MSMGDGFFLGGVYASGFPQVCVCKSCTVHPQLLPLPRAKQPYQNHRHLCDGAGGLSEVSRQGKISSKVLVKNACGGFPPCYPRWVLALVVLCHPDGRTERIPGVVLQLMGSTEGCRSPSCEGGTSYVVVIRSRTAGSFASDTYGIRSALLL